MTASNFLEAAFCNTLRATSFSVANVYVKLHLGDPGEDCTATPATEATRKLITFAAPTDGVMAASNQPAWTSVAATGTEVLSHFSLWDALTVGNALGSGALSSTASVTAGDNFTLTACTFTVT